MTNETFSLSNESFIIASTPNDASNNNHSRSKTILEYPSTTDKQTKYITDEAEYTSTEAVAFFLHTTQQSSQAITVLSGLADDNINYVFDVENGRVKMIFSQDDLSSLVLTTKNETELLTDGHWHRLNVERFHRKLRFLLDDVEQSSLQLSEKWQMKTNLFVGADLIPAPNGDYIGQISDITITNSGRFLNVREDTHLIDVPLTTKAMISRSSQATNIIGFLPNENQEIVLSSPITSPFRTLSFSFRSYSRASTLIRFHGIDLNIDIDGYLTFLHAEKRIDEYKPINNGQLYFVQLILNNQTLEVWVDSVRKITIELSSSVLLVETFVFGSHHQFLGCIENVTYNEEVLSFPYLSSSRRQCSWNQISLKSTEIIPSEAVLSLKENDRPLIRIFDHPKEFYRFSFAFSTEQSESIICSLADQYYEEFLLLSIVRESFVLTYHNKQNGDMEISINQSINDRNEHQVMISFVDQQFLMLELDGNRLSLNITKRLSIKTIYFGKLDGFIREQLFKRNEDHFLGCIRNLTFNGESLIQTDRLTQTCRLTKREPTNTIPYISSNISFSVRNASDMIEIPILSNTEFYQFQLTIKTHSSNGVITLMYSSDDHIGLLLSLKDGQLQLRYPTTHLLFSDNQPINDGEEHSIYISRQNSYDKLYIQIDKQGRTVSLPGSFSFFFNVITLGGSYRRNVTDLLVTCLTNPLYNHQPFVPADFVDTDRYDCSYHQKTICHRDKPCDRESSAGQLCGQTDCSLVCGSEKGSLEYLSELKTGRYEEISLAIFTTSTNSTLFLTRNGSIQVSISLQNSYPRLIIQNAGMISTYDFPGRIRSDQWHVLQCQKTLDTLDLTFDEQTRHYTNLTEHFSLFNNEKVEICGRNFIGYIQDIVLMADNHYENLIQNSIRNPRLIDSNPSVTWNNRASIPERTPCERIQCLNGGYCIQPATQTTLAYCHCPSQYSGYRCEQAVTADPCLNYQCNHGACQKDRNTQPYCSCYDGYGGSRCETQIDPCAKVNCNYGRCEVDRSRPACRCYQGYTGHECLTPIDACARVSCNYSTCINEETSYRCECHRGYEGAACDRQIDPCSSFVCYNGGVCHVQENLQAVCQCAPGYRGANCYETDADPCLRYDCYGGTCTNDRGSARCICPTGRAGSRCQDDICVMYPCANSGQCVPEGGSRRCICSSPYYGDDCREFHRPNPCDNLYCGYGQCREGVCECHSGYSGVQCDVPPDLCAGINCNHGQCFEGRCSCSEGYTGDYCDALITTPSPAPQIAPTTVRPLLTAQTVGLIGPKTGQLIDYGRLLGARAGPIGGILALVAGLILLPLALAFAARKCTQGGCATLPKRTGYVPVVPVESARVARDLQLDDQRGMNLAASSGATETTRIEQTREIVREYGGMESAGGVFTTYPTMSSRYGDFAKENQQQTSAGYQQQHIIETDYHAPPVADFGYSRGGVTEGYRDTFESWEGNAASGGYSMNAMFADGGLQTDYELSNINSVSMTPNGKYAIVGQSQGPPQIWDAVNGQLVSSMQGTSVNCSKVALACSGTLLVGLASDGIDSQASILQIWDVNTGKPVQLTHQIKCATFTLSNNSNNLIMAGNQKYGRGISVGILDLNNSELTKEIKSDTNQSYGGSPSSVSLTPDERFAIVACPSGSTTNYITFDLTTQQELIQPPMISLDAEPKNSLVINNEQVLTGTRTGQLILWDIPSCQRLHTLNDNGQNAHRDRITDLKISPDHSCVVTTSADGTAKVWDTNSKELISRLIGHKREITCACVSTNQLVATGSKDQNICLWRIQTGQIASTMPVGMTPLDIHMAAHNRTVVAIGEKDGERQLLMLRVVSIQR